MAAKEAEDIPQAAELPVDEAAASALEELFPPEPERAEAQEKIEEVSLETLKQQLSDAQTKAQDHWEALLRLQAEQENLRRRMIRDVENAHKYALEKFAQELLPVKDSLEMGLDAAANSEATVQTLREGSELILKMLSGVMEKFGIQELNPLGEKFDPHQHEAMAMAPDPNAEPNSVLLVHQKGYALNERLLRPARVVVAKG